MEPGGADPLDTGQVFPPDAPRGRSVSHGLIALRGVALRALIELLADGRPTRTVEYGRSFAPASWDVLSLADVAERALEALWCEDVLRSTVDDEVTARREKHEQALSWLDRWGDLGAWHEARLGEVAEDWLRAEHAAALLRVAPDRARTLLPSVHAALKDPFAREGLLRAIGAAADPAFAPLLLADLVHERIDVALEAALGLVRVGDPRGRERLHALAREVPGSLSVDALERIALAGAPLDAGRIFLEVTDHAAWFDWHMAMLDPQELPRADVALGLSRIVARQPDGETRTIALETLRALTAGAGPAPDVALAALIDVRAELAADPVRRRHAAATLLALGVPAVGRFEAAGGPPVRPELLEALRTQDPVRRGAFVDGMGLSGPAGFAWAAADLAPDAPERALLARARVDASLWVRGDVDWLEEETYDLPLWLHGRWEPARVGELVAAWEADPHGEALVLTVERAVDLRGVSVRAELSWDPRGVRGIALHVQAPGLSLDGPIPEGALGALLTEVGRALESAPDAPAKLRLVATR